MTVPGNSASWGLMEKLGMKRREDLDYIDPRFGPDLTRPVGPIHWACTDLAGIGHMHMEGAIRSGKAAAHAVLSLEA